MSAPLFSSLSSALSRLIALELAAGDVESASILVKQLAALWVARLA